MIQCARCKETKPEDDFYRSRAQGRQRYCKDCNRAAQAAWREKNRDRYNAHMRDYMRAYVQAYKTGGSQ